MKKGFAAILLLIYFTVSTGFTVNLHYCMDKFHSWEFGAAEDDKCDQCGMNVEKSSGCCRDEVKVLKLQQDFFGAKTIAYQFSLPFLVNNISAYLFLPFKNAEAIHYTASHDPPLIGKQDTYIDNCVFRI